MHLLLNHWTQQLQNLQVHRSNDVGVLGNISCDLVVKVKGQIMFVLVNTSPPELLDVATSNFAGA